MIKNARTEPKIYYGLHFVPGLAEYRPKDKPAYRVLVEEDTMKQMDATFPGRPVYVDHVNQVDLANIQEEADGYVIDSFFNKSDGKSWAKFIVVSDAGHQAIANGWRLSNAYHPESLASGGLWHGVEYQQEIKKAKYDHLAIVKVPRYDESVILNPEQFKEYNARKEAELATLTNELETQGEHSMLNFFKRTKVENSADFENTVVQLPKTKKEFTIAELVKNADMCAEDVKSTQPGMANGDDMVDVDGESMTVNALISRYKDLGNSKKMNDENLKEEEEKQVKKNKEDEEMKKKKENEAASKKDEEMKKNAAEKQIRHDILANAHLTSSGPIQVSTQMDQVARGKSRYSF